MRILFTTFPAYGHFHPMVPLASAATMRGHDVRIATGRAFGRWVTACGFTPVAAGLDLNELEGQARARFPGPARVANMFTTVAVPPMLEDLIELSATWRPDLIIHEESEYSAPLAALHLGVPCIAHSWAAPACPEADREIDLGLLEPVWRRRSAGMPVLYGDAYLDACPPAFQTEAVRSIDGVRRIRPVVFDGPPQSPPPWLSRIERPAAYVSFGTVSEFSRADSLRRAVEAAAGVVRSVVVTSGANAVELLEPLPPSVFVERYLPQSSVLEHVDVVVSHGGAGTTLGALWHALPHVVVPQGASSQLAIAESVAAAGIGMHVPPDDPSQLRAAVRAAVTYPSYAIAAAQLCDELDALPAPRAVLTELLNDFA